MTKSFVSVLASVLAGVLSCTPSQPGPNTPSLVVPGAAIAAPGAVARITGCWRLQSLDWRAAFLADSTLIYLDTATVRGQPPQSAYAARLFFPSLSPEALRAGWAPFGPGDSLYVTVGTPYHGVRLRLGRVGDSLMGMGRNWNDTFTDTQAGPVRGARTSCVTRPPAELATATDGRDVQDCHAGSPPPRQRSRDTSQLAIFDIDGTLTATNAVDDECYARAVAEMLDVAPEAIDWSDTPHVTDSGIARYLWERHRARNAEARDLAEIQQRFLTILRAELTRAPERFVAIAGADALFPHLRRAGWHVALATGGWLASATVKLRAAGLMATDLPMACADDAESREEIVRLAREKAEAQAGIVFHRVVSVGDAPWDVRTARSLGLPFVGIATGILADRLRTAGAKTIVPDFSDAAAVLAALSAAESPVGDMPGVDAPA